VSLDGAAVSTKTHIVLVARTTIIELVSTLGVLARAALALILLKRKGGVLINVMRDGARTTMMTYRSLAVLAVLQGRGRTGGRRSRTWRSRADRWLAFDPSTVSTGAHVVLVAWLAIFKLISALGVLA